MCSVQLVTQTFALYGIEYSCLVSLAMTIMKHVAALLQYLQYVILNWSLVCCRVWQFLVSDVTCSTMDTCWETISLTRLKLFSWMQSEWKEYQTLVEERVVTDCVLLYDHLVIFYLHSTIVFNQIISDKNLLFESLWGTSDNKSTLPHILSSLLSFSLPSEYQTFRAVRRAHVTSTSPSMWRHQDGVLPQLVVWRKGID